VFHDTPSEEVAAIIAKGEPWTDPEFKPDISSLLDTDERNYKERLDDQKDIDFHKSIIWKRASELFGNKCAVFDGIGPEDIGQGQLGDCYFLQAIAGLAKYPPLVKRLFRTQEVNKAGIYEMTFIVNGVN